MKTKSRILIVDDDKKFCDSLSDILVDTGYVVEIANNGKDAINLSQNNRYDIVLVDFKLPDISGTELVNNLASVSPSIEFILMTANATLDSAVEAVKQERVVSYELKPLDMDHFLSILNQVVKRKHADMEREKSEIKYHKLIETAQDAIICCTGENGIVKMWNQSAEKIFGYSKAEIIGKPIDIIVPDEYKKQHQEGLKRFINTGISRIIGKTVEVSGITKGKKLIPVEMSLAAQKIEDGNYFITAIIRDLTERKKMEGMLLQSEKLKSLGTVTAGVSHDFNNILAIISGNIQLLEGSNKDNKELMDTISTIERAVKDGAEITRRMLKFTSSEKDTAGFELHDINKLIKQAIDFTTPRWRNMAQAKGKNYHIETEGTEEVYSILCNPAEIREALVNLINNSLDAMPDGGCISFNTWSRMDMVFMSISDNGEGMSDDIKKKVFDPFFTTKGVGGTGLGMSMTYGIISKHGGEIKLESKKGKGSTYTMHFPIPTKAGNSKETFEMGQEIKSKGLRIMVVDDNKEVCRILDKFFSNGGHMVRIVDNGAEAIMLTKIDDYDLVLCDMVMPEVYGYEVIKALNKLEKRPKIGLVTGWGENLMPMEEEEFKVDFIIKKPFDFSELVKLINDLEI